MQRLDEKQVVAQFKGVAFGAKTLLVAKTLRAAKTLLVAKTLRAATSLLVAKTLRAATSLHVASFPTSIH